MKITRYDLVRVTRDEYDTVTVRGAVVPGGTAFVLLDIEYRHLSFDVVNLIWRAVYGADHVAIIGAADVSHVLGEDLAIKAGQAVREPGPTEADDAADEVAAFDTTLADIAALRARAAAELGLGAGVAA